MHGYTQLIICNILSSLFYCFKVVLTADHTYLFQFKITKQMRKYFTVFFFIISTLITRNLFCQQVPSQSAILERLKKDFETPPPKAKTFAWWHWMGSNITKQGITKDLEAMKAEGLGGATIFNLTSSVQAGANPMQNSVNPQATYRSEVWWDMLLYAAQEADRLGLELGIHNAVGYSGSGGPWISPERTMQKVAWGQLNITGPVKLSQKIPSQKSIVPIADDIAFIAIPQDGIVQPQDVIDISNMVAADGTLNWDVPTGKWKIYRFYHIATGSSSHPRPEDVTNALECDKLSAEASKYHLEQVINPIKAHLGNLVGRSFKGILFDSYEAGELNWTAGFREKFIKINGYDPIKWLPVLDKRKITDSLTSTRFQYDMKSFVSNLFITNFFEQARTMINQSGMQMLLEPYSGPFDTPTAASTPDLPMGEFWTNSTSGISRAVTGAAQAQGIQVVGAEAFTGRPDYSKYTEDPAFLKTPGDAAFCSGVNKLFLHTWTLQPLNDNFKPGFSTGWWGTHFGRNQIWFEPGKAYIAYLNRCQAVLQHGWAVSNYCSYETATGNGDVITSRLLANLTVKNHILFLPNGRQYYFMILPNSTAMLPEVAQKIKDLVWAGATILAPRPLTSPSLVGYPNCDSVVKSIGNELYADCNGIEIKEHSYGKGKVVWGKSPDQILKEINLGQDVDIKMTTGNADVHYTHRKDGETDIYFIANYRNEVANFSASFRINNKVPELWYPETGKIIKPGAWTNSPDNRTVLNLSLKNREAVFVIFSNDRTGTPDHVVELLKNGRADINTVTWIDNTKKLHLQNADTGLYQVGLSSGKILKASITALPEPIVINQQWKVAFTPGWGAPALASFDQLISWTDRPEDGIKYFSGTGEYTNTVEITKAMIDKKITVMIDLGKVSNMADVYVNGKSIGVLWHAPFEIDITDFIKLGTNLLKIKVTNTWNNRLIGDLQQEQDVTWGPETFLFKPPILNGRVLTKIPDWVLNGSVRPSKNIYTFSTWNYYEKSSALTEAGLMGPVVIKAVANIVLNND